MKLSMTNGTETLVQAEVTPEQAHHILNYLGHTYVDPTTKEDGYRPKVNININDMDDVVLVRGEEVFMTMQSVKVSKLNWEANTDYDASTDLLASMVKCYKEDTMDTQAEGLSLAFYTIDYFSELDEVWDISQLDAIDVIQDFLAYVRGELSYNAGN